MSSPEDSKLDKLLEGKVPKPIGIVKGSGRIRVPPILGTNFDGPIRNIDPEDRSQSK